MKTVLDTLPPKKRKLLTEILVKYFDQDQENRKTDPQLKKFCEDKIAAFVKEEIDEETSTSDVRTP